jgi:hypothetical protein
MVIGELAFSCKCIGDEALTPQYPLTSSLRHSSSTAPVLTDLKPSGQLPSSAGAS